ncbi:MAG: hypothetical protein WCX71_04880 [Candidatus Buchananbacteria bacterium]
MPPKIESLTNMHEWEANRTQKLFHAIADEIRSGRIQTHCADNDFLFAKTDEILHFALAGEKLVFGNDNYQSKRAEAANKILENVNGIAEGLLQYPKNNCPVVQTSLKEIKELLAPILEYTR